MKTSKLSDIFLYLCTQIANKSLQANLDLKKEKYKT